MHDNWLPVKDIPVDGATYAFADAALWENFFQEFNLPYTLAAPLRAEVYVLPQDSGCLVRGTISGSVIIPCSRCAEDSVVSIEQTFEEFEPMPAKPTTRLNEIAPGKAHSKGRKRTESEHDRAISRAGEHDIMILDSEVDEEVMRLSPEGRGVEINIPALLWEEFILALPEKILCAPDCKGLCRSCGQNLNAGACACKPSSLDPRLEKLQGLKMQR